MSLRMANDTRSDPVPPYLVSHLPREAQYHKDRDHPKGEVELVHVTFLHLLALPDQLIKEEEVAKAIGSDKRERQR